MPDISVLVKPSSSACNLNCRYCFYKDEANCRKEGFRGYLDDETTEILIKKAIEFSDKSCSFMFQGGEPTLRGLDYYRRFVELEKKYAPAGMKIYNSIQTNGILIDTEWAEFLAQNGFLTGLSLDGYADLHNLNRCFPDGGDSFNSVMKAAAAMKSKNAQFNILSVVTGQSSKKIEKIYNFFKKNGFTYLQFIPCLEPLNTERGKSSFALSHADYGNFLIKLFDLWFDDIKKGQYISIRYFDNLLCMLKGCGGEACNMSGHCSLQFVIEGDGKIYPCDFFVLDGMEIGDIKKDTLLTAVSCENAKKFIEESLRVPDECKSCKWYPLCRNGCKRDRIFSEGIYGKNYYCNSFKMFFENRYTELKKTALMLR